MNVSRKNIDKEVPITFITMNKKQYTVSASRLFEISIHFTKVCYPSIQKNSNTSYLNINIKIELSDEDIAIVEQAIKGNVDENHRDIYSLVKFDVLTGEESYEENMINLSDSDSDDFEDIQGKVIPMKEMRKVYIRNSPFKSERLMRFYVPHDSLELVSKVKQIDKYFKESNNGITNSANMYILEHKKFITLDEATEIIEKYFPNHSIILNKLYQYLFLSEAVAEENIIEDSYTIKLVEKKQNKKLFVFLEDEFYAPTYHDKQEYVHYIDKQGQIIPARLLYMNVTQAQVEILYYSKDVPTNGKPFLLTSRKAQKNYIFKRKDGVIYVGNWIYTTTTMNNINFNYNRRDLLYMDDNFCLKDSDFLSEYVDECKDEGGDIMTQKLAMEYIDPSSFARFEPPIVYTDYNVIKNKEIRDIQDLSPIRKLNEGGIINFKSNSQVCAYLSILFRMRKVINILLKSNEVIAITILPMLVEFSKHNFANPDYILCMKDFDVEPLTPYQFISQFTSMISKVTKGKLDSLYQMYDVYTQKCISILNFTEASSACMFKKLSQRSGYYPTLIHFYIDLPDIDDIIPELTTTSPTGNRLIDLRIDDKHKVISKCIESQHLYGIFEYQLVGIIYRVKLYQESNIFQHYFTIIYCAENKYCTDDEHVFLWNDFNDNEYQAVTMIYAKKEYSIDIDVQKISGKLTYKYGQRRIPKSLYNFKIPELYRNLSYKKREYKQKNKSIRAQRAKLMRHHKSFSDMKYFLSSFDQHLNVVSHNKELFTGSK